MHQQIYFLLEDSLPALETGSLVLKDLVISDNPNTP
jgi:hypothetical protein